MKWPAREGLLLLGGVLFAFFVWVPVAINVLPRFVGRDPGEWRWGFEHLPEFFGSQGADHAIISWVVALMPYFLVQTARILNWAARIYRRKREPRETLGRGPDQV